MTELLKTALKRMFPGMVRKLKIKRMERKLSKKHGRAVNIQNPRSLSEKIQWMIHHCDLSPLSVLVDKLTVRDFVAERVGSEYLIPLVGTYERFDEIDFDALPQAFVLKATHGSGWYAVVTDKSTVDWDLIREKVNDWLGRSFEKWHGETNYRGLKGKIILEKFLQDQGGDPLEFKFYCCHGEVMGLHVAFDRAEHQYRTYTADWQEFKKKTPDADDAAPRISRPANLDEMMNVCRKLAAGFPFVRVDLYDVSGKVYFGELTFTPGAGIDPLDTAEADFYFGDHFDVRFFLDCPHMQGRWPQYG